MSAAPPTLDAVCPLTLRDAEQARLVLLPSLRVGAIRHLWVICPPDDVAAMRRSLSAVDTDFEVTVLPETAVVPELTYFPGRKRGWFRQQLLKLAAVDLVGGDHYLTLDGDICCLRPWTAETFVRDGRALLVTDPVGIHPEWYSRASSLLGLPPPDREMSVTPVIFSTEGIRALARHIEDRLGTMRRLGRLLPASEPRRFLTGWRGILLRSMPWTEMGLYLTFMDGTDATASHHWEDPSVTFYGGNVWSMDQAAGWSAEATVEGAHRSPEYYFAVLGSKTGLDARDVREELAPLLPHLAE